MELYVFWPVVSESSITIAIFLEEKNMTLGQFELKNGPFHAYAWKKA